MSKFSDKFVDGMSLVAEKVDENKFLGAIKDSFTIYMPFVIVGSFMNLFNTILCSTTTGLAKWVPALEALKPIFTAANFATLSCMTLPIVFLIGLKLGKKNNVPEHISAIMALASAGVRVFAIYCQRAAKSGLWGIWKPSRNSSTKSGRLHTNTISHPASNDKRARS